MTKTPAICALAAAREYTSPQVLRAKAVLGSMGRALGAARIAASFGRRGSVAQPAPEPTSGVHMRVAPREAVESFSSWVSEQVASESQTRVELEELEESLLAALQARDIPAALMHACVIVYLDPGHKAAQRIKKRCTEEMRRLAPA